MDVRQFELLARQPSARLVERPRFWGMPKRGMAFLLANVMFWQPLWAQAEGIAVSNGNTSLGQAGNGVPVVNIAAPNASGLSHNQYQNYNVGSQGVILNNATGRTQSTQLGGIIVGNPNLKGQAASTILNEVTGANASQLNGYTEVAGQAARVIVANPYGVTCNGCGFINTPRVTLTTGKPVLDNGQLDHFNVQGGSVSIEGAGLNADNLDQFEIITRSAKINAELHAKNITVVAGRNDVNAQTLAATALAEDGSAKPQLAIDSSALGGMYAGAIKLVGTEAGVGVRLAGNLAASAADIQIDAAGHLNMAQASANNAVNVKAAAVDVQGALYGKSVDVHAQGDLTIQQNIAAQDRISLSSGGQLSNSAIVEAGVNADNSRNASGDLELKAQNLRNSASLVAARTLKATVADTLNNQNGSIASGGKLTVTSKGALSNQGGKIATDAELWLTSASLDNSVQGRLSGIGLVRISTGAFDNSQHGHLSSSDRLQVTAAQLTNRDGGSIGSQNSAVLSVTGLDQRKGTLFSNGTLSLDLHNGQLDNQAGLINSPGALALQNLGIVNNQGGEISSAQGFTFAAQTLDNSNGKLLSDQPLVVRVDKTLNNVKGMIAAASIDATSGSLDNSGGTLTSRGNLDLTVDGQLSNRDAGLINSQGSLQLTATDLDSSNAGAVSAVGNMDLTLGALVQNGGRLVGGADLTLDLQGGDLDNQNGLLTAAGELNVKQLRDLNNQHGEISSANSFSLTGRTLDNSGGRLVSDNLLTLTATQLTNQNGLISGGQGLQVGGGQLDNRNLGTLSSRSGDLTISLSGALLNGNQGALVTQRTLTVNADSLDNRAGILSSGAGQALTIAGTLDNSQNGLIDSGADLVLNAMTLGNAAGTITAQQAFSFSGTTLDNSAGSIASNGAATLDLLGVLTNNNGKFASAGPLRINRAAQVNNQGGQLASQSLMTLLTGGLDNSNGGTLAAVGPLQLTATGAVQNGSDGLIYSKNGDVQLQAASLGNSRGTLQSSTDLTVTTTGNIDNQSGSIIAQTGDLSVTAADLDNRGGVLSSLQSAFTAQLTGVLKNGYDLTNNGKGGVTQAQRLNLTALGGLNNYGGRLSAQAGDLLLTTTDVDNRNGGLYAKGRVSVTGNNFDNSGDNDGQIAGDAIDLSLSGALNNRLGIIESDSTLAITAASIDNYTGKLRALGTTGATRFQIGNLFDNHGGTVESANTDLILNAGSFQNAGGSVLHVGNGDFAISLPNVTNAGGSLVTRGGLTLNADSWTNSSVIQAGRLNVNVGSFVQTASGQLLASSAFTGTGGTWQNDGLIASDGALNLTLTGAYNAVGRATSLGVLTLGANQLNLAATGSLAGGANSAFTIAGQLANAGRITSAADLRVDAGSVLNRGTLGGAQNVTLNTPTLVSEQGLLFSGGDMTLAVDNFTNRGGDLYGLGNVGVKGYGGAARASQVNNISGSMESGGDLTLNATSFQNTTLGTYDNYDFGVTRTLISGFIAVYCLDCAGDHNQVDYIARETFSTSVNDTTAAALVTAGRDFTFNGSSFNNTKSTVTAVRNIDIHADNVKNTGAAGGIVERTRTYETRQGLNGPIYAFLPEVVAYNQRNNPDFPNVYYKARDGQMLLGVPVDMYYADEGMKSVYVKDAVTGAWVSVLPRLSTLTGYQYGVARPVSAYDPNNLAQLPAGLASNPLIGDVEVTRDGGTSTRNAVIQAGGNVSIIATQDLQNSVIRGNSAVAAGASKVANTSANGTGSTVVINLSAQLPDNLAQQQINPLALPGFSLPTGQNGLFRLSDQGASPATAGIGNVGPQSWSLGNASISAAQRDPSLPGATIGSPADALQSVARVQGVPTNTGKTGAPKYLIETNPALTDLKQFMSSDYLLSELGYDPDVSAKRLGDGLYEQRLVQQAIISRTGKALIDGQTSNEAMYQYLMTNAVAEKDALNLSIGVGLSSEQVASLTHDIVWLEDQVVNGEKVLVPVVYLAKADGRLESNGTLIAGNDVNLVAGQTLNNSGTLKATNNLSASAGQDLVNSGVIKADARLDVLAVNNVTNQAGGLIAGRDVSVTATLGDVINQRTLGAFSNAGIASANQQYAGDAARIEAANDLSISAGRDITNSGSSLSSGRNMTLSAGRDVSVVATQVEGSRDWGDGNSSKEVRQLGASANAGGNLTIDAKRDVAVVASQLSAAGNGAITAGENLVVSSAADEDHVAHKGSRYSRVTDSVTQVASGISAGSDLAMSAGGDLSATASKLEAKGDVSLAAGGDMTLASAADESHFYAKGKHTTRQDDKVTQVATTVTAGGNASLTTGKDMTLVASQVSAGQDASLIAGGTLNLLAAQDSSYSLYDMKKKGSFGSKKTQHDEITDVVNVGSAITSGRNLTLVSGGDQRYQGAKLGSGSDLTLDSGGSISFEAVKDSHQESHSKSSNSWAWTSMESKGQVDETLRQSQLTAKGQTLINAVDGLHIDVKDINQQSVSQAIDAMVQADPSMAWLKEAEARNDVEWRQIQELHDSWDESHSGLGGPAMLIIIIIVTYFTAGAASGALGTAASATAGSTSAMSAGLAATAGTQAVAAGWANAALTAMITSAASTAAVSTINNKGNIGAALEETFSVDNLKNYIVAGGVAGLTAGFFNDWTSTSTGPGSALTDSTNGALANTGKVVVASPGGLSSLQGISQFTENQLLQNTTSALLNKALGRDGSLSDALQNSLVNAFTAYGFNLVGDIAVDNHLQDGGLAKIGLHALMGGLASVAAGGDFKTGALAAGVNEALVDDLASAYSGMPKDDKDRLLLMNSQLIGVLTTTVQDPTADIDKLQLGSSIAQSGTQYNYLSHQDVKELKKALSECQAKGNCDAVRAEFAQRDADNTARLNNCGATGNCAQIRAEIQQGSEDLYALYLNDETGIAGHFLNSNTSDWNNANTRTALDHLPQGDPANAVKVLAAAGLIVVGPEAIALMGGLAEAGATICAANPILCANEVGIWVADLGLSEALPVGIGAAAGGLTAKEFSDLRGLMEIETKTGTKLTSEEITAIVRPAAPTAKGAKGISPVVTAEGKIGDAAFTDVNQTARPVAQANPDEPTLIADRVTAKTEATGKSLPNGNMADAHAEIGVIQQAYNAGKTQGADMTMSVAGKDVCGFCKGDIAAAAEKSGLSSLTIQAIDDVTGLPKKYNWVPGMRSIKEVP